MSTALKAARLLGAATQIATDLGVNYLKVIQAYDVARSEDREPTDAELRSAIDAMHEAGRDARDRVER